jgi:hypothetical protein
MYSLVASAADGLGPLENLVLKLPQKRHKKSGENQGEGANADAEHQMRTINNIVRSFLGVVEIPVFGVAVFALMIFGERDFWSPQVKYQTEPIATIGR